MSPEPGQGTHGPSSARVAVLGAFDRFNYGDLLFPVVIDRALRAYGCPWPTAFYASVAADLRRHGGQRTQPIRDLFRPGALPDGSVVVVAGGEVLDARWTPTLETLLPAPLAFVVRRVRNRWGEGASDALCRRLAGTRLEVPWVVAPEDFAARVRVAYNCVGGSHLAGLPAPLRARVLGRLARADFLAVRDAPTRDGLSAAGLGEPARLAPDCAVLVSRFFPPDRLERLASAAARELACRFAGGYVCFQINRSQGHGRAEPIASELALLTRRHGLGVVLLPNGRARNHEDHLALAAIQAALGPSSILAAGELSIYDILFLIASATVYAGTSLHGSITALSYAVPHLGLTRNVPKLEAFLRTWDLPEQQACVPLEGLSSRVGAILGIGRQRLEEKREELVRASLRHFDALFAATGIAGAFEAGPAMPAPAGGETKGVAQGVSP